MRQLLILFLVVSLLCPPLTAWGQSDDASVFAVTDVATDVTSTNAARARDQAIAEAQRTAFGQLLERLGSDPGVADNLRNDDIATLVQNFEVQNEHSSPIRYLGTFTVQFKPNAVRSLLGGHSTKYTETQSKPVLILPLSNTTGHPILWEESTKWRAAWEASPRKSGLVPIIIPAGNLDDIAALSTEEAVNGKTDSIKNLIDKYQAGSAAAVTLSGDPDKQNTDLIIDVVRYDGDGTAHQPTRLTLPVPATKTADNNLYTQAIKMARAQLEKNWREENKTPGSTPAPAPVASPSLMHLLVTVPVPTLAEWAQVKRRLGNVPTINHVNIITLARGTTTIELEFRGSLSDLQNGLTQQNLSLTQSPVGGTWILQTPLSGNPL